MLEKTPTPPTTTSAICPGSPLGVYLSGLRPGQQVTLTITGDTWFTGFVQLGKGATAVATEKTTARFTATGSGEWVDASFTLGIVLSSETIGVSTDAAPPAGLTVTLLGSTASASGEPVSMRFRMCPPTCSRLYPDPYTCDVCHGDVSACPQATQLGLKGVYLYRTDFFVCLVPPY